jgi:streptogramin lyase
MRWLLSLFVVLLSAAASAQTIDEFPVPSVYFRVVAGRDGTLWAAGYDLVLGDYSDVADTDTEPIGFQDKIARITTAGNATEFPLPPDPSLALSDLTLGPDGNIWFVRSLTYLDLSPPGRIGRLTPAGEVLEFSLDGEGAPVGIAAGPDGNLWVTGAATSQIYRMTTAGQLIRPGFQVSSWPFLNRITAGPDGKLWFTEYSGNRIGRITIAGVITEFPLPTASSGPTAIAAGPDGNLWFIESSANKIGRITPAGVITEFSTSPDAGPGDITAGPDGNLWFTEARANRVGRLTTAGIVTEFPLPTPGSNPTGIAAGSDGNIWFIERGTHRIGRLVIATAPAAAVRILPVVGSTPGANDTFFRTSVQLNNPGSTPTTGRIVFHPSGFSGSGSDPALPYSLAPGQTQSIADLLPAMGVSGLGSADVEIISGAVPVVTARVFNDAGPSGTTGFTEAAMRAEEAIPLGQKGVLLIPPDLTAARFNVGVRTLKEGATLNIVVYDRAGTAVGLSTRVFPPDYHEQQDALGLLRVAELPPGGSISMFVNSGAAIVYGATVDNRTGDPSFQVASWSPWDY